MKIYGDELISVIIPIYRVEKYLERCVYSIVNQTYTNLEIILVDDGSPDRCGAICNDLAKRDVRIRVIHKENGGLSDARNAGLEVMTGKYVAFVDSDDYVSCNYIEHLYSALVEHEADLSQCSFEMVKDEKSLLSNDDVTVILKDGLEMMTELYGIQHVEYTVVWNKLYRAELFRDIRFPVGKLHEDEYVTYKIYDMINKAAITSEKLYAYYQDVNSITRSRYSRKRQDVIPAFEERLQYFARRKYYKLYYLNLQILADSLIYHWYCSDKYLEDQDSTKKLYDKFRDLYKKEHGYRGLNAMHRCYYSLYYYCPGIFKKIFEIYQNVKRK